MELELHPYTQSVYVVGRNGRPVMNSFHILIGALASHFLAGGQFVQTSRLMELGLALFVVLFLVRKNFLPGPKLALILILAQSFGHIVLGETSGSNFGMLVSHVIGGLISYKLVAHSERFWNELTDLVFAPFQILLTKSFITPEVRHSQVSELLLLKPFSLRVAPSQRRGPPTFSMNGL
ncbi:unannotated protein [freshwater metagenome]